MSLPSSFDHLRILDTIDQTIQCNFASAIIHCKINFAALSFLDILDSRTNHLQFVLNFAVRAVTETPNLHHIRISRHT